MKATTWEVAAVRAYDFLSSEYRALFAASNATVFQSPLWLDRLYRRLTSDLRAEPLIVTIRATESNRLTAILPLVVRSYGPLRIAEFADFGASDYLAPICDPQSVSSLRDDKSIRLRVRAILQSCDLLFLRKIRSETLPLFDVLIEARHSPLPFASHAVDLFAPFPAWREASISPSQRRFLDTKRKKLKRRGKLTTSAATSPQEFQQALDSIREFRAHRFRTTGAADILAQETFARFYQEVAAEAPPARTYLMKLDEIVIAAAFGLLRERTFHVILTGFDFLNFRNASLGLLLIEDIIADCVARGENILDMTIGDQAYKREFGTSETAMWSIWSGISLRGRLAGWIWSRSGRIRKLTRRLQPR